MILPDKEIRRLLGRRDIIIRPMPENIQPASVDLYLGATLILQKSYSLIDRYGPEPVYGETTEFKFAVGTHALRLHPGEFVLGATKEWIEIPDYLCGILVGKSTLARDGLQIEAAGYLDPGWKGCPTLEIKNMGRAIITLRAGMPICQIRFEMMVGPCERPYGSEGLGSHYQESHRVRPGYGSEQRAPVGPPSDS